jgi:ubiquinone/menaquinone biosynthesis C-methylase UbiE
MVQHRLKRAIWTQLLDELGLRGDEHVLDVGCGRGAVLMLAARRVPAGRAVGAEVWRRRDQSGNSRAAAERNAAAEGVSDRVALADADARDLPFASASFDPRPRRGGVQTGPSSYPGRPVIGSGSAPSCFISSSRRPSRR